MSIMCQHLAAAKGWDNTKLLDPPLFLRCLRINAVRAVVLGHIKHRKIRPLECCETEERARWTTCTVEHIFFPVKIAIFRRFPGKLLPLITRKKYIIVQAGVFILIITCLFTSRDLCHSLHHKRHTIWSQQNKYLPRCDRAMRRPCRFLIQGCSTIPKNSRGNAEKGHVEWNQDPAYSLEVGHTRHYFRFDTRIQNSVP